ncbi:protein Asterix-like [Dysidea avara]|uniref:protein Asterix-like n=1 Tax=Dysidea avara TaxID=196820 RepID=UPI0033240678
MAADPKRAKRLDKTLIPPAVTTEYVNAIGMMFSLAALLLRWKWSAWIGVFCSLVHLTNSASSDDRTQILSLFMLSTSSLVMVYMQNPAPMSVG